MKIAWLHSHFFYSLGATRYIFEVNRRLTKKYDLTVFVEKSSDFWKERFTKEGIKVKEISPLSSNSSIYWLFFPFFVFWEIMILKREIRSVDLVITSIFPMNWCSLFLNKPNIFLCFEPYSFFHNKNLIDKLPLLKKFFTKLLAKIYSPFDYIGTKKATKILALNKDRSDLISEIYQRKPDGTTGIAVDSIFFKPVKDEKLTKKYLKKKVVFHSTDFTTPKGTYHLINALTKIVNEIPEARLVVASTVENAVEKKKLREMVYKLGLVKNVEFLGCIEEKLLPAYYTIANITAFVADPKNTISKASLIVLESLACQTPVVCSVGQLEGMVDKKTGYFVNPKNTKDLANKIIEILENDRLKNKMGIFGRGLVAREYTWDRVATLFEKEIKILTNQWLRKKLILKGLKRVKKFT